MSNKCNKCKQYIGSYRIGKINGKNWNFATKIDWNKNEVIFENGKLAKIKSLICDKCE